MQLILDTDPPAVACLQRSPRDGSISFEIHSQTETGSMQLVVLVAMGTTLTDADYRAVGQAVMAALR